MAYHIIHELTHTIRLSPMRAAFAAVLLISTTIYVCADYHNYRVAKIGDTATSGQVSDLTAAHTGATEIEQVVADADDAPATTTRVEGRERYIDAHLTHAVAVEDDTDAQMRTRVEQMAGITAQRTTDAGPVWLLGIIEDD